MEMELPVAPETTPPAASSPRRTAEPRAGWPALLLFFLAPACAELLTTSAPPVEYFNPLNFVLLHAAYGSAAVLLREWAVARRIGTWGRVFLALAMGLFIEGVICKTFFSPQWTDFNFAQDYGRFAGVNWTWTISLLVTHGLVSFLIPWFVVDLLWPRWRNKRSLTWTGLIGWGPAIYLARKLVPRWRQAISRSFFASYSLVGIDGLALAALAIGALGFFTWPMTAAKVIYHPPLLHGLIAWGGVLLIPWLAARVREPAIGSKAPVNPTALAILAFLWWVVFQAVISWWMTDQVRTVPALIVVPLQLLAVALALAYARLVHGRLSPQHHFALLLGSAWFWCTVSIIASLDKTRLDNTTGSWIVGIVGFVLVLMLGRLILRREQQALETQDLSIDEPSSPVDNL